MQKTFVRWAKPSSQDADVAFLFAIAFTVSAFGILTRPIGAFAGFWPANAVALAVLLRLSRRPRILTWLAAFSGFIVAEFVAGDSPGEAFLLTISNFSGICIGYVLLSRIKAETRRLTCGRSVVILFGAAVAASGLTASVGAAVSVYLHHGGYWNALMLWFSSELVNYITIMPCILSLPDDLNAHLARIRSNFQSHNWERRCLGRLLAVMLMCGCCYLGQMLGGPGALLFPLPALLLIAMVFSISTTSAMILIYALWCNAALTLNTVDTNIPLSTTHNLFSMRLGMTFLALGPLTVGSMNAAREALLAALDKVATRDGLTGLLNRQAFMEKATALARSAKGRTVILMLDIDHFKSINDQHGHAVGDQALIAFSSIIAANLRANDVFGRIGGEEFSVVALIEGGKAAEALAQRLVNAVRQTGVRLADGTTLGVTVSIGGVVREPVPGWSLESALKQADLALYEAKHNGRNRAEFGS